MKRYLIILVLCGAAHAQSETKQYGRFIESSARTRDGLVRSYITIISQEEYEMQQKVAKAQAKLKQEQEREYLFQRNAEVARQAEQAYRQTERDRQAAIAEQKAREDAAREARFVQMRALAMLPVADASSVNSSSCNNVEREMKERQAKLEEQTEVLKRRVKQREAELEEQEEEAEELQAQINAQNSTITISEGVSRDVQVITPGHIIDLRR